MPSMVLVPDVCVVRGNPDGIHNVWIFDPRRKKAYRADSAGVHDAADGVLETAGAPIAVHLSALWS
jgi:hypothetical protein